MYLDSRLWAFTDGVRARIALSIVVGLLAAALGVARLALLGWLIARVFRGDSLDELWGAILLVAAVMILRGALEYLRTMLAHRTAALVQRRIRAALYDKAIALGPAWFGLERTGEVMLAVVDGVEQLETYFGEFLPQIVIAAVTPVAIFAFVVFVDQPVALALVSGALVTLFAPALFHRLDRDASMRRSQSYARFGAEFLDSVQGLATLKAFGQARARAKALADRAHELAAGTLWVNATNALGRGITDAGIAIGAGAALWLGAHRVIAGEMSIEALLIVLMMGVELFRPLRDLRAQLHTGMLGQAAAQSIFRVLDATPVVQPRAGSSTAPDGEDIEFDNVCFNYPGSHEGPRGRLNFRVRAGERVALVGASGAGKSTIVRLLLRFYDPQQGAVRVGGKDLRELGQAELRSLFAVVNQDTYLFNGTVADNLRFGSHHATQAELERAARAANAHEFIVRLPQGYDTVVGERGIKLSGGQRQRVAIARALLRDAPILILDEALSAVDAENEAVIQQALNRLMQGRTTLVAAHRLSSVIDADRVLVLRDGQVVQQGDHATLIAQSGPYRELMGEQAAERPEVASELIAEETRESAELDARQVDMQQAQQAPTDAIVRAQGLGWAAAARELLRFVTTERLKLAFTIVFGVLRVIAFIGVGVVSAMIVARVKSGTPFDDLVIALAVTAPAAGLLHWLESWFAHDMAFKLLADMRIRLFAKLEELAPAYLLHRRTGDLAAMATQDVETVEYFYAHTVAPAFVAVLVPIAVLAVLLWFHWSLALSLAPFLVVVALSPFLLRRRLDRLGSHAREALAELNAHAVDSIQGLGEIIAFQAAPRRRAGFLALIDRVQGLRIPFYRDLTAQAALLEAATGLGGLAIITSGSNLVVSEALNPGTLPLLTLLAMAAFLPVSEIAHIGRQLADTLGSARRLYAVNQEPVPVVDGEGVPELARDGGLSLQLDNLSYTYRGRREPALANVNLRVTAGETVALVGPSGAGKTTLAHLLVRFWDPQQGRACIGGFDLRDYRLDDLRQQIALVAQDTYLFNDTLRNNILIARPDAGTEQLRDAVSRAALNDVIAGLPQRMDTPVGERGMRLSGGQRQRVAIARAFLKDAPVLILDEATSHLDAVSERAVRKALRDLMRDRTTVVIAHRLSTVRDADTIVVLRDGRLVERGSHETLLRQRGLYARLVAHQLRDGPLPQPRVGRDSC